MSSDASFSLISHTARVLLEEAIVGVFPTAQLISGQVTDLGFSCDAVFPQPIGVEALPLLEQRMLSTLRSDITISSREMVPKSAAEYFLHHKQPLRAEMVRQLTDTTVPLLQLGSFQDVCPEPHPETLEVIGALRLLEIGKVTRKLPDGRVIDATRISGTAFGDQKSLKRFLKRREDAKERDHILLGGQLDLFVETPDGVLWTPRGTKLRHLLLYWWRDEHLKQGYIPIASPRYEPLRTLGDAHILAFQHQQRLSLSTSLPQRYCEFSALYPEMAEEDLCGLFRLRGFTADMATTICRADQAMAEITSSLQFLVKTSSLCGFDSQVYLVGRSRDYAGTLADWAQATQWFKQSLAGAEIAYQADQTHTVYDGPTIEVRVADALGRMWTVSTLCVSVDAAKRLDPPSVVIQRSTFCAVERLIALLLEYHSGELPLWLAPEQVRIFALGEAQLPYAKRLQEQCMQAGFRAAVDVQKGALGARIYAFEATKVPYALIVGEKEEKQGKVALRERTRRQENQVITLDEFFTRLRQTT